jgi:hypothetical protein
MEGYGPEKLYAEVIQLLEKQIEAREMRMLLAVGGELAVSML